jgi:hypothetical protein
MSLGYFFLGLLAADNKPPPKREPGSLLLVELVLCSVGLGFFCSSWIVFWICLVPSLVVISIPTLRAIVSLLVTFYFTCAAFLAGLEFSVHWAFVAAVVVFFLVVGTHFDFDNDKTVTDESKS